MTRSRQEEINLVKSLINEEVSAIDKEIDFANTLISDYKNKISLDEKYTLVKRISSLENKIIEYEKRMVAIIDSLATATEEINKKKFLLIDSHKLLALRDRINKLSTAFHEQIHNNFFGISKGQLVNDFHSKNDDEMIVLLFNLVDKILSPSIATLNGIKSEILAVEDWLRYKQHLRELEKAEETDFTGNGFENYYHVTDHVSNFENNLLNRKEDIFFAENSSTALAQKMGVSGRGSGLTVIQFRIAKNLNKTFNFVKPHSTDSYADANTECFYIDAKDIDEINRVIKSGKNLINVIIHSR